MLSQSDYLKKRRVATILKEQTKLQPILDSSLYTVCKEYGIIKKINVLDNITDLCPTFITCNNTQNRDNRKPMIKRMVTFHPIYVKDRNAKNNCCN